MIDSTQLGLEFAEYLFKSQKKIADHQVDEAHFKLRAAQVKFETAQNEAKLSAKIAARTDRQSVNYMRPSFIFKPFLTQSDDDDDWTASYGELVAHGTTPETAYQDFDRLWSGKDEI